MNTTTRPPLQFKIASEDSEFEQIHQLNYKTFVEEIPQHQPSASPRLVDKFHAENTYLICLCGGQLVGMMAVRGNRPFSLDQKLAKLDEYLPGRQKPCEVRLLAVEKEFRSGQVFRGLLALLWQHGLECGYDLAVISGTTRQTRLYRHLGFVPFGPLLGTGDAMFQPMYITLKTFEDYAEEFFRAGLKQHGPANFLPGPVAIHKEVRKAFEQLPQSHRSETFMAEVQDLKKRLCELANAKHVQVLLGSGTLGNDTVAAQLSLEDKPGLVISNGEFGDRLADHAKRMGLTFDTLKLPWGQPYDLAAIKHFLQRAPTVGWIWCVHGETSVGVLNPLDALKQVCAKHKIKLAVDCMSTVGLVPVNLDGVFLATCASGKGLAAYPGLAVVFHQHEIVPTPKLPRYLDIGLYAKCNGIAFTHSSNLLRALDAAVKRVEWPQKYEDIAETSAWLRSRLRESGFEILAAEDHAAAGVITIRLPSEINSSDFGAQLQQAGYLISCGSDYLRSRNWVQICLMGEFSRQKINELLYWMKRFGNVKEKPAAAATKAEAQPA
jgi:aspartate aminotransferase-like enzyme